MYGMNVGETFRCTFWAHILLKRYQNTSGCGTALSFKILCSKIDMLFAHFYVPISDVNKKKIRKTIIHHHTLCPAIVRRKRVRGIEIIIGVVLL